MRGNLGSLGRAVFLIKRYWRYVASLFVAAWLHSSTQASQAPASEATASNPMHLQNNFFAIPPVQEFEPESLPLCECTGLHSEMKGETGCALSPAWHPSDICFIPRSYCLVVEPPETLAAFLRFRRRPGRDGLPDAAMPSARDWEGSLDGYRIRQSVVRLEQTLPVASTPSCRCWALGEMMVAPCDQGEPVQKETLGLNFLRPYQADMPKLSASFVKKASPAVPGYRLQPFRLTAPHATPGRLARWFLYQQSGPAAAGSGRKGRLRRLGTSSPLMKFKSVSDGKNNYAGTVQCHKSCATCLEPGRDRCRSCSNQLSYPYNFEKRPFNNPANGRPADSDARAPHEKALQFYALVAAHRDGSGYCIPLAFGDARGSSCDASEASCAHEATTPSWNIGAGDADSPGSDQCHQTCAVCRADCCRKKPDNCLACKDPRRVFRPVYRDGTGRCLEFFEPESNQSDVAFEEAGFPPAAEEAEEAADGTKESSLFSSLLSSIMSVVSSHPKAAAEGRTGPVNLISKGDTRRGPSFLPRRSFCESLPQKARDLPIRSWSQFVFVHADNNLEESALLDLDEMLHPWRGEVVKRHARAAARGRGTPPLPVGGAALPGVMSQEALEQLYLIVLIDRSKQPTTADMGRVHACPQLDYSSVGQGVRQLPGTTEVELDAHMAFELLRVHLQDGRREWLLLRALGEVDMNDPFVLATAVTRFLDIFPSRHYAVVLWNHGSAWAGFGDDESNPNNQPMSIQDIAVGLKTGISGSKLGKVDRSFRLSLLGFDACLMGSYDVLEALAPLTHFFLASEENEPGHGWNYKSMDPTAFNRNGPPPYRTATAFEYGTRFVASYGLHPPSSNALTLALIEVRAFNEFNQKFEELLEGLYSCGGSNITRRVRRALLQTYSVRGCRMLGLCSCYDLNDFLANLLQQFATDENELGRISVQALRQQHIGNLSANAGLQPARNPEQRLLQQLRQQDYSMNSLSAARRILTDKVMAARVLFKRMIVAEVGSREPGRYGGLSIYFPDPNMAVTCKTQRSASGWARRYTSIIRTKFSSFVTSVLANRKGSVCYAPWGSLGDTGKDISDFSKPQQAETPQWFGVLCSRTLAPFSDRRPAGAVGIAAVLPITVASAVMFRGFVATGFNMDKPEIIVTSTAQATMTDAEIKGSGDSSADPGAPEGRVPSSSTLVTSSAFEPGMHAAAKLREFTFVQGWWDSQVWTLRQQLHFDDPIKDPRFSGRRHQESSVEAIVVALQEGPASSRVGGGRAISFSFPVLFFKNAVDAECLQEPLLRIEAVSTLGAPGDPLGLAEAKEATPHSGKPEGVPGPQRRHLQSGEAFTHEREVPSSPERRRILSTTVLPLGLALDDTQAAEAVAAEAVLASSSGASGVSPKPQVTAAFTSPPEPQGLESGNETFEDIRSRHLSAAPPGSSPWLLHERLGRDPQTQVETERQCGTRAYLLADWDEQRKIASAPVLYVIQNAQATEWPRSKGGLIRPIEHRLRRQTFPQQTFQSYATSSHKVDGNNHTKTHDYLPADKSSDDRFFQEFVKHQPYSLPHQKRGLKFRRLASSRQTREALGAERARSTFSSPGPFTDSEPAPKALPNRQRPQEDVPAVVLEESVGEATFFWNAGPDGGELVLKPKSVAKVLQERRTVNGQLRYEAQATERPVVGLIAQDLFDRRALAAHSTPLIEPKETAMFQNLWESVGHSLGFLGSATGTRKPPSASAFPTKCSPHWLGDGVCDEPCDTPLHEFDRGDCPHLNRSAEDLLEQQEPKGACVDNRCSELALCEAYEDTREDQRTSSMKQQSDTQPDAAAPLVATIWEGPRGRYVCRCPKGYTGDGTACEDINECEVFAGTICHSKAVCINTKGSYRCLCKPGYTGDGRDVCMPSTSSSSSHDHLCLDSNSHPLCPASLQCLENGSCGCREGFFMENGVCTDVDECASGLASCASPSVATCINTRGGYFCSCIDGYEGDGRQCVASPSTAEALISIAMDYTKTLAAAGGADMLKEALVDAILQAVPGLADRTRIEVSSLYEGSIDAVVRIHPPTVDATAYPEGPDTPRQLTAAEVLLALQEQLAEPLSPLRTGPFGEYAAYATIERYTFLDRSASNRKLDLLALLTDWLPAWIKDAVPREALVAVESALLLVCMIALIMCTKRAAERCAKRNPGTTARQSAELPRRHRRRRSAPMQGALPTNRVPSRQRFQ